MGSALRLHPLLVIFGLLAGTNIDGLPGALIALPLLAVGRATWEFFAERVVLESWAAAAAHRGRAGRGRPPPDQTAATASPNPVDP